jgi:hypothetical protein
MAAFFTIRLLDDSRLDNQHFLIIFPFGAANPYALPPPMKSLSFLFCPIVLLVSQEAHAFLNNFEAADGYTLNNILRANGNILETAVSSGRIGPELNTYNAGSGTATISNITDNTGKFVNNSGGGTKGDITATTVVGQPTGFSLGDTTYLSAHETGQASGAALPAGYSLGAQLLAFRTDAKPFADPRDGPHNAQYSYTVDSQDFLGLNPAAVSSHLINISFIACVSVKETKDNGGLVLSTVDNVNFRGLEMSFGGTAAAAGARIGWTDENNLAYFDNATNAWVETNKTFDFMAFDKVSVSINTLTDTWSLVVNRHLNTTAYASETIFSNIALDNIIGANFGNIVFTANEDLDGAGTTDDNGLAKTFFDSFAMSATAIPEPSNALLTALGAMGWILRRRR